MLVITTRKSDLTIIDKISDSRIKFYTWTDVANLIQKYCDHPIAKQFIRYGKMSGEFEQLGELTSGDILLECNYYKTNNKGWINYVMENFLHELDLAKYGFIESKRNKTKEDHWGRSGVEINFKQRGDSYYQWWFLGYYYDTSDHKIEFLDNVPEIVAFFDIDPLKRALLCNDSSFNDILEQLQEVGFKSNLRNEMTSNDWRLLTYSKPINQLQQINAEELVNFADEVFGRLLQTNAISHKYFREFIVI